MRPTSDRVREATFNSLGSMGAIEGATVLDLFAGTGAMGIEALSRGAKQCVFVEADRNARRIVEANLAATGLDGPGRARVVGATAQYFTTGASSTMFDLALVDPPYAFEDWAVLLDELVGHCEPDAVLVTESDREITAPTGWMISKVKRYGGTVVSIHVRATSPSHSREPKK